VRKSISLSLRSTTWRGRERLEHLASSCISKASFQQSSAITSKKNLKGSISLPIGNWYLTRIGLRQPIGLHVFYVTVDLLSVACHTSKACDFHARVPRNGRFTLADDVTQTLARSFVGSMLNYCKSRHVGRASMSNVDKLQRVKNYTAIHAVLYCIWTCRVTVASPSRNIRTHHRWSS